MVELTSKWRSASLSRTADAGPVLEHSQRREHADVLLGVISIRHPHATVTDFTVRRRRKGACCFSAAQEAVPGPSMMSTSAVHGDCKNCLKRT